MEAKRVFTASPAVREAVPLLIGLVSPSGGGKTMSALRLATGIQRVIGGPIVLVDTENRRALHYADQFKFLHVPFTPPFSGPDYLAAIRYAAAQKPACIIIDSMTHEHSGEGGYLDTAEKVIDRIAGDDYAKRERAKFVGWAKAGPLRTSLIEGIKQISGSMICCWRGKEKTKPVKTSSGRTEVVEQGLMAIGGTEWIYEMTVNCLLPPRSNGVPDWEGAEPGERMQMKLPVQFRNLLKPGRVLDEDLGQAMAEWARGGIHAPAASLSPAPATPSPPHPQPGEAGAVSVEPPQDGEEMALRASIEAELRAAVEEGETAYRNAWSAAMKKWKRWPQTREYFVLRRDNWLIQAQQVDQQRNRPPDPLDDGEFLGESRLG